MKRKDIDRLLAFLQSDVHRVAFPHVAALAEVVADQERRLRALEPCPKLGNTPHEWSWDEPFRCAACGLVKEEP